jgi:hypothetical protein
MANKKVVAVNGATNLEINLATEEAITLLRRMVKLLESNSVTDIGNRQRVTVDVMPTVAVTLSSTTISALPIANQFYWEQVDRARQSYALGIRANLAWS